MLPNQLHLLLVVFLPLFWLPSDVAGYSLLFVIFMTLTAFYSMHMSVGIPAHMETTCPLPVDSVALNIYIWVFLTNMHSIRIIGPVSRKHWF